MFTFLIISKLLRVSVFRGWCWLKSVEVQFPQYLPICSGIDSQVENYRKLGVFEKPVSGPLLKMQYLKKKTFSCAVFQGNHDQPNLFCIAFGFIGEKNI